MKGSFQELRRKKGTLFQEESYLPRISRSSSLNLHTFHLINNVFWWWIFFRKHGKSTPNDRQDHHALVTDVVIMTSQCRCTRALSQSHVAKHDNHAPVTPLIGSHDDAIKWKHFPRYWTFVRGIHRSPVNNPHKSQWRGAFIFSLICDWINRWVNNREAGDLRRYRAHYNVTVMGLAVMSIKWLPYGEIVSTKPLNLHSNWGHPPTIVSPICLWRHKDTR